MTAETENKLLADVHEIRVAIIGNPEFQNPGLLRDVDELKRWRRNLDLRIASISGFVCTVIIIVKYFLK